jgi:WD40 repeat protein
VLERKLLTGHRGWVSKVAISPDGTWIASASQLGSEDKKVKIWDLETGELRATLSHNNDVSTIAVSYDGTRFLSSAIQEKTIRIWETSNWSQVASWHVHKWGAISLAPLVDGNLVFSSGASFDGPNLRLFAIDSGICLKTFNGHTELVSCAAVSKDGRRGISGSHDRSLRFWNLETGECLATLKGHSGEVNSVQITPDGRFAVSASEDKTVKVWDLEVGTCIGTLEGHQSSVPSVAISPVGTLIASAGFIDGTVRLWDWRSGACLQVIESQTAAAHPAASRRGMRGAAA